MSTSHFFQPEVRQLTANLLLPHFTFSVWALCPECWLVLFYLQSCVLGTLRREMMHSEHHLCHSCVVEVKDIMFRICPRYCKNVKQKDNRVPGCLFPLRAQFSFSCGAIPR